MHCCLNPGGQYGTRTGTPLKLHLANAAGRNTITAYGPGYVEVNGERHQTGLVVLPSRLETNWAIGANDEIGPEAVRFLAALQTEIVLIGTGAAQRFPKPATLRPLIEAGIGFEVMSTPAACRTYNMLVAEDRVVAAALIP